MSLGLQTSDNISSVIVDNSFLSTTEEPLKINDTYYIAREQYIIDKTSENFKNDRIIIPKPISLENDLSNSAAGNNNNYIISIAKLFPKSSTVVSYIGANMPKLDFFNNGPNDKRTKYDDYDINILNTYYLKEQDDYIISENSITIFTNDKDHLKPDLSSPIIITILQPKKSEEKISTISLNNLNKPSTKVFEIKDINTRRWLKI